MNGPSVVGSVDGAARRRRRRPPRPSTPSRIPVSNVAVCVALAALEVLGRDRAAMTTPSTPRRSPLKRAKRSGASRLDRRAAAGELARRRPRRSSSARRRRGGAARSAGRQVVEQRLLVGGSAIWATAASSPSAASTRVAGVGDELLVECRRARRARPGGRRAVPDERPRVRSGQLNRSLAVELRPGGRRPCPRRPRDPTRRLASSSSEALETTSSASPIPIRIPTASAMKTAASEAAWYRPL